VGNEMSFLKRFLAVEYFLLSLILLLALFLRLYFLFTVPQPPLIHDAHNYDVMARQFLEKGFLGYASAKPNAYVTPGYPLFLALIYAISGYSEESPLMLVRIIQVIISVLTIFLLYLLAKETAGRRTALLTAFFASIYLVSIWVPTLILTEALYTFFFILYLYIQMAALNRKSMPLNFAAGIILALAVLVRPLIAPLIILPYVYYYIKERDRFYIKSFFINAAGFVIVMLPWWIRNLASLNRPIIFATQEDPLLRGTYPYEIGVENIPYSNQKEEAIKRLIFSLSNKRVHIFNSNLLFPQYFQCSCQSTRFIGNCYCNNIRAAYCKSFIL
jgi:4-amino-4-deoxy-L-arabinose transferase-like glycosyltransferase